jgi:hypothetical protein
MFTNMNKNNTKSFILREKNVLVYIILFVKVRVS